MKGGKLTCRRVRPDKQNCIKLKCIDREKNIHDGFETEECDIKTEWEKYRDDQALANYWYNWKTGEATWINPLHSTRGGKKKFKKKNKTRKVKKMYK